MQCEFPIVNSNNKDILKIFIGIVNNEAAQKAKNNGLNVVQNKCTKVEYQVLFN